MWIEPHRTHRIVMTAQPTTFERRRDECVSNRVRRRKRPPMGYSFFVVGGIALVLHHGWVAGLGQDPMFEFLFVGFFFILLNAGWLAPTLMQRIERLGGWKGFLWFLFVTGLAAALSWSVARFVYLVNLFV
jgi:hypothetical protein